MNFNVTELLQSYAGYKGLPFPAGWFAGKRRSSGYTGDRFEVPEDPDRRGYVGEDFEAGEQAEPRRERSRKGTAIYKKDLMGRYYFMPVTFIYRKKEYEIDCALVSITGKKTIVQTPLAGRNGSVKELISVDDYQIAITGAIVGEDRLWPEEKLNAVNELYTINQSLELKCALAEVFLGENDRVVITDLSVPSAAQTEHVQLIELKCVTDRAFELTID